MSEFDYIIVGAGSAGCVLAERLTLGGRNRVLLIEQGGRDDHWLLRMPQGFGQILKDPRYVTAYATTHPRGPDDAPDLWLRGRTLGGSSSVNGMVWVRGQPEDYDRIAELGNPGWGWADLAPYFKRLEDHALGEDEVRGRGGPIAVRSHPDRGRLADAFIAAGEAIGIPRKDDLNRPEQEGIGYLQSNVDPHGRRVSAARAFLEQALKRKNLAVATGVQVDRILFEGRRAVGVGARRGDQPVEFRTRGEVILSAGGVPSPKILQLSGVGPADHLRSLGVPVVHDSPGVGENLREHFLLRLQFRLKHVADSANRQYSGWRLFQNVARYAVLGQGVMTHAALTAAAFSRTEPGLNRPDAQLMFGPFSLARGGGRFRFEREPGMQIFGYLLRPESRGSISITSADPAEPPRIDPQYLTAEADRRGSVAMIRQIRRLIRTQPIAALVEDETAPTSEAQSDEAILKAFSRFGAPGYHACGACAMGQGPEAVVDERLRVRGVEGLRVMDTSIYPEMLSGNTNAPTLAFAWRASDLILQDAR